MLVLQAAEAQLARLGASAPPLLAPGAEPYGMQETAGCWLHCLAASNGCRES